MDTEADGVEAVRIMTAAGWRDAYVEYGMLWYTGAECATTDDGHVAGPGVQFWTEPRNNRTLTECARYIVAREGRAPRAVWTQDREIGSFQNVMHPSGVGRLAGMYGSAGWLLLVPPGAEGLEAGDDGRRKAEAALYAAGVDYPTEAAAPTPDPLATLRAEVAALSVRVTALEAWHDEDEPEVCGACHNPECEGGCEIDWMAADVPEAPAVEPVRLRAGVWRPWPCPPPPARRLVRAWVEPSSLRAACINPCSDGFRWECDAEPRGDAGWQHTGTAPTLRAAQAAVDAVLTAAGVELEGGAVVDEVAAQDGAMASEREAVTAPTYTDDPEGAAAYLRANGWPRAMAGSMAGSGRFVDYDHVEADPAITESRILRPWQMGSSYDRNGPGRVDRNGLGWLDSARECVRRWGPSADVARLTAERDEAICERDEAITRTDRRNADIVAAGRAMRAALDDAGKPSGGNTEHAVVAGIRALTAERDRARSAHADARAAHGRIRAALVTVGADDPVEPADVLVERLAAEVARLRAARPVVEVVRRGNDWVVMIRFINGVWWAGPTAGVLTPVQAHAGLHQRDEAHGIANLWLSTLGIAP